MALTDKEKRTLDRIRDTPERLCLIEARHKTTEERVVVFALAFEDDQEVVVLPLARMLRDGEADDIQPLSGPEKLDITN